MPISELNKYVAPPELATHIPKLDEWEVVQSQLGVRLPTELKEFCAKYGVGSFRGEETVGLSIWCPIDGLTFVNELRAECQRYLDARGEEESDDFPFKVFPEAGGLLPLGSDENDVWLCWVTNGPPDEWSIAVRWTWGKVGIRVFNVSLSQFLVSIFKREIDLPCWPAPMFESDLHFVPYHGPT